MKKYLSSGLFVLLFASAGWGQIKVVPIEYQKWERAKQYHSIARCPADSGRLYLTQIPCPEGRIGCAVLHWGWRCEICMKDYEVIEPQIPVKFNQKSFTVDSIIRIDTLIRRSFMADSIMWRKP